MNNFRLEQRIFFSGSVIEGATVFATCGSPQELINSVFVANRVVL